jgi:glycosyltransferase involved in cell wall biosynthesis
MDVIDTPGILPGEMLLSVIIPARDEADSIGLCLDSLTRQSDTDFELGKDWELIVVDDHSSDATSQIAASYPGVTVIQPPAPPSGWSGKTNALWSAAQQARGRWLLFTDADTIHEPGDLRRAIHEAERYHVGVLTYSPRQLVQGFWQRALMPLIFGELAGKYPPRLVNHPDSPLAAANGQFILIDHALYRRLGGHKAISGSLLEDVDLARSAKRTRAGLRFRHAPDAVSTRMYRSNRAMLEGWRKNLVLLFPDALTRGLTAFLKSALIFGLPLLAVYMYLTVVRTPVIVAVLLWWAWRVQIQIRNTARSHFPMKDVLLSPLALPLFGWLLVESWSVRQFRRPVIWKGRTYAG